MFFRVRRLAPLGQSRSYFTCLLLTIIAKKKYIYIYVLSSCAVSGLREQSTCIIRCTILAPPRKRISKNTRVRTSGDSENANNNNVYTKLARLYFNTHVKTVDIILYETKLFIHVERYTPPMLTHCRAPTITLNAFHGCIIKWRKSFNNFFTVSIRARAHTRLYICIYGRQTSI